jgi:hypothetical protein
MWSSDMSKLVALGKRTVFHVPQGALDRARIGHVGRTARDELHAFLRSWCGHFLHARTGLTRVRDDGRDEELETYEVSLATEREFRLLVDFLGQVVDAGVDSNIPIVHGDDCFYVAAER